MKKFLLIAGAIIALSCTSSNEEREVYICLSESSYAYHFDSDCRGLNRCKHEVKKVTVTEAKEEYKRRLCGYED